MKKNLLALILFTIPVFFWAQENFSEIDMVFLPAGTYTIGEDVQTYKTKRSVNSFFINKYETTYNLWYETSKASQKLGYNFAHNGLEGSEGKNGRKPTQKGFGQPVINITWYDAVVWCNALSELNGLTPCYTYKGTVLKDSSNTAACDLAECNWQANGYRLPSEAEWEYAARYTKKGMQKGNCVSGDLGENTDEDVSQNYAWYWINANCTRTVGTAGTPFESEATTAPATGNANAIGIYDMSGNVLEYCWDWFADYQEQTTGQLATGPKYAEQRVSRGGSFSEYTMFIYAADRYSFDPNEYYNYMGFRLARTATKE